jgi:Rad3-related DNA helicase
MANKKYFPYENFRENQEEVIDKLSKSIKRGEIKGFRAPCGFGKTISGITAALENNKKVILVTPNYPTRAATVKEVLLLNKNKKHKYKITDLSSKESLCLNFTENDFSDEACKKAKKYEGDCLFHTNLYGEGNKIWSNEAEKLFEVINKHQTHHIEYFFDKNNNPILREEIKKRCYDNKLCAYYFIKDKIIHSDIIILDYNWIVEGQFKHLKDLLHDLGDYVLLIDEGDQFLDRISQEKKIKQNGIDRFKTNLIKVYDKLDDRDDIKLKAKEYLDILSYNFNIILKRYQLQAEIEIRQFIIDFHEVFGINIYSCIEILIDIEKLITNSEEYKKISAKPHLFLKQLIDIIDLNLFDKYILYKDVEKGEEFISIKPLLMNDIRLNNSLTLLKTLESFYSVIIFSATLDEHYFKIFTGIELNIIEIDYNNIVLKKHLRCIIFKNIDSKKLNRDINNDIYYKLLTSINNIKPGVLAGLYSSELSKVWVEKYNFISLKNVDNITDKIYVISCHESEARGTNIAGNLKTGIAIGFPLKPEECFSIFAKKQNQLITKLFNKSEADNFQNMKAIFRTIQFLGRVTRDIYNKKRLLILADERFLKYLQYFPKYIANVSIVKDSLNEVITESEVFWNE